MENFAGLVLLGLRIGLALALFLFLFWSVRIIWKDFIKTAQVESENFIPQISLSVNAEHKITQIFTSPEILVGRGQTCDFQIPDETVSSLHTRLFFSYNQWWAEDYGSSNGTYLNEVQLTTPAVLTQGDQLRIGKIIITLSFLG